MAAEEKLTVDPAVLAGVCESLSGAADQLLGQLKSLDGTVSGMLADWQGASGGAYEQAWAHWLKGADEVESALSVLAELLGRAAEAFEHREARSAADLGALRDG